MIISEVRCELGTLYNAEVFTSLAPAKLAGYEFHGNSLKNSCGKRISICVKTIFRGSRYAGAKWALILPAARSDSNKL